MTLIVKPIFARTFALFLGLVLTGCIKLHPPVNITRYQLPPAPAFVLGSLPQQATDPIVVTPITLAAFLDGEHMVVGVDPLTLTPTRDHLWVDSLKYELARGLQARLQSQFTSRVVLNQASLASGPAWQVRLHVNAFHAQADGLARFSGEWTLRTPQGEQLPVRHFDYTAALTTHGYPAMVIALGNTLDQLVADLYAVMATQK